MGCKRRRQGIEGYTGTYRNRDDAGAANAREKNFTAAVPPRRRPGALARPAHGRRLPVRHQLPGGLPLPDTCGGVHDLPTPMIVAPGTPAGLYHGKRDLLEECPAGSMVSHAANP